MSVLLINRFLLVLILVVILISCIILIARRDYRQGPARWLGLFLVMVACTLLSQAWLNGSLGIRPVYAAFCLYVCTGLLLLPLLYCYVASLTVDAVPVKTGWIHFLPAALAISGFVAGYFMLPGEVTRIIATDHFYWPYPEIIPGWFQLLLALFNDLLFILQILIYLISIHLLLTRFKKKMAEQYSDFSQVELLWIRQFLLMAALYALTIYIMEYLIADLTEETFDLLFLLTTLFLILFLVYFGLRQRIPTLNRDVIIGTQGENDPCKTRTSVLSEEQTGQLLTRLDRVMQTGYYLEPGFNIARLASEMGTNRYYVSLLLNVHLQESFYNYINRHRIEKAKELILEAQSSKYSLEGIAHLVGYKSKSSFIEHFRKYAGLTPGEFKSGRHTTSR